VGRNLDPESVPKVTLVAPECRQSPLQISKPFWQQLAMKLDKSIFELRQYQFQVSPYRSEDLFSTFVFSIAAKRQPRFISQFHLPLLLHLPSSLAASESQTLPQAEEPETDEVIFGPAPPFISLDMAMDPSIYSVSSAELPNVSFSLTSHATHPITICTNGTVLSREKPFMHGKNYTATDITTNQRVWFSREYVQRAYSTRRQLGHRDEKHFLTLLPKVPVKITYPFSPIMVWKRRDPSKSLTFTSRAPDYKGEEFRRYFEPGHKYRFGIAYKQGIKGLLEPVQTILWWRYGTKEEVLAPREAPWAKTPLGWSEQRITFRDIPDAELTITE
jgi:hypothetical protein